MAKSEDFIQLLRHDLKLHLSSSGYKLTYDNEDLEAENSYRRIFKLIFKGDHKISISNKDWRDYTEHFHLEINNREVAVINLNEFSELSKAYDQLVSIIPIPKG